MTEQSAPETGTAPPPETGTPPPPETGTTAPPETGTGPDTTDWRAEAEKYQALMRKEEAKAKANAEAARELVKVRREAMSDAELAADRARTEAVAEVTSRLGGRLVLAEIRGAVAGRLPADQLTALLEHVDLAGFMTAEGDVDAAAVQTFATRIAPESTAPQSFPELGQGPRTPAGNGAPDPLLRDLHTKLGISS